MTTFHFLRPEWLWGFLPLAGLLVFLAKKKAAAQLWESVCDTHLLTACVGWNFRSQIEQSVHY